VALSPHHALRRLTTYASAWPQKPLGDEVFSR
jgi:hypothetical protein